MIPLRTDSPLRNTPYMNGALIAANVIIYLFELFGPVENGVHWFSKLILDSSSPHIYMYFSYAFLHDFDLAHGGWMHLVGNMLFLYVFGNNVNDKIGHIGYLAFYLAGGVLAGMAFVVTNPHGRELGASGAIAAVVGAYLILFPRSRVTVLNFTIFIGWFEIPSIWFIGLFFFFQDLLAYFVGGGMDNVAHISHIGGTLFGCAVCLTLLSLNLLPRDQYDVVALFKQWNRRRVYRDAVNSGWNPYLTPSVPPPRTQYSHGGWGAPPRPQPPPPDPNVARVLELRTAISEAAAVHDLNAAAELYLRLTQLDPRQVLPRQSQLDVANQLASQQLYPEAAAAYEVFLKHYPKFEQIEQVELMLGLIYARYLTQYERAKGCLVKAIARLHGDRELSMARSELSRIEPFLASPGGAT